MSQESGKTVNGVRIALHPPGSARQRRTLDERLRVRFPALVRPVGAAFLRLPPSWRLRRLMLARSILRAYAAANRRDFDLILTAYDARLYEYHPSADLMPPDFEPVYHGHSGYLAFWRRWLDVFPDIRWTRRRYSTLATEPWLRLVKAGTDRLATSLWTSGCFSCSHFGPAW